MHSSHADKSLSLATTAQIRDLLESPDIPADESRCGETLCSLSQQFQKLAAGKRYFPISIFRELARQRLKQLTIQPADRIRFYVLISDAILLAMAGSPLPETARMGQSLQQMTRGESRLAPEMQLLLRLHHIIGLNRPEIAALFKGQVSSIDSQSSRAELARELEKRGLSQQVLLKQNLRPRGNVTKLLEDVRDGRRPLGDVVVQEQTKLRRQAAHLLKLEKGSISVEPDDLVNEMFLRLPTAPEKSPVNRMEFEALTRRIMRHILIDRARRPIPRQGKISIELSVKIPTPSVIESQLLQKEVLRAVNGVLQEMRRTDRETAEMLRAALLRGRDQRHIAKLYGVSVSTVKRRISDCRHRIRERLGLE
jgi:RNA polymerase sigma factor (sigma-70 family)